MKLKMKKCNICKFEKEKSLFKKDNRRPDGYGSYCKECLRIKGLEYYQMTKVERKETINENRRRCHEINKNIENEKSRQYKIKNSENIKKYNKEYRENNKDKVKLLSKEYRENNKDKVKEYQKLYINNRLENDPLFKIKHYLRCMIRKHFNRGGYSKISKTQEIIGCSFEEFKLYIESKFEDWMTWENRGLYNGDLNYGWDIDHIIPVSSGKTQEDIIRLNYYTNLQPLCSHINRDIKRDSI